MMDNRKPLIELKHLEKHFGGVRAVQDVSLTLYHNEIVAIVGDNGAGKSTLIKMIAGTYVPDSGEIWIEGVHHSIRTPQDAINLGIETMYQDLALIPTLDAPANIFLGREFLRKLAGIFFLDHRKMEKEARDQIDRLEIDLPSIRMEVEHLSGGQRQAVALAKTLSIRKPKLLIMDEPTAALGVEEQSTVLNLIRKLKGSGVTILIISHNLDHVLSVAERIVVMKNGKLAADLQTTEVTKDQVAQSIVTGCGVS